MPMPQIAVGVGEVGGGSEVGFVFVAPHPHPVLSGFATVGESVRARSFPRSFPGFPPIPSQAFPPRSFPSFPPVPSQAFPRSFPGFPPVPSQVSPRSLPGFSAMVVLLCARWLSKLAEK